MNDLRHDPDAHDPNARVLPAASLRTVPFRDPRYAADCRTADDKVRAELVRLVDALQALTLRVEELERGRG